MIIDHGDHYHSLIAHAYKLFKRTGELVGTGDTVASVGSAGSSTKTPGLYFEIRHHGIPVNPMEWLDINKSLRE
jgi:septal ring factor EnvC (AmiA/AmiB activator)